jgi:hypothetical protein
MAILGQTATEIGLAQKLGQMPARNKLVAEQQRAARALQLQQAIAAAPGPMTQTQVAQAAGQVAQAAGQQQVSQAQQMMKTAEQAAQLGMGERQATAREQLAGAREMASAQELAQTSRLAQIDKEASQQLFDKELQIQKDANDRGIYSARQLADYAMLSANRKEAFANWSQKAKQYSDRNLKMLEVMENKLRQAMDDGYLDKKQKLNQSQKQELAQIQKDLQDRIAKAQAKKQNIGMMSDGLSSAMSVAGAALMFTPAAPVGVGLMAAAPVVGAVGQQYATSEAQKEAR